MDIARTIRVLPVALLTWLLAACAAGGDITRPIPTAFHPAEKSSGRLVVVLPGRGDDLASLQRRSIASIIQGEWPDADVVLTGLTMPFYRKDNAPRRLHDEIIEPARARGARQIWIMGISLGGMGAILYEREYPDQADGLLLLSPYLGDREIQDDIRAGGGLREWTAGVAQPLGPDTFERELWRTIQQWNGPSRRADSVWLAYGADEPFRESIELMSPALPREHVLIEPGRHNWQLWTSATRALLKAAAMEGVQP